MRQEILETQATRSESIETEWLQLISDPERTPIDASHLAVIVAHPDDVTIGCGALLARLKNTTLVVLTDGSPRDLKDANRLGLHSVQEYAAVRSMEMVEAMALAGVSSTQIVNCNMPERGAALNLVELVLKAMAILRSRETHCILTTAYEGGHPDHDAAAFVSHMAAELLARGEGRRIGIVEMPLYHAGENRAVWQDFAEETLSPVADIDVYELYLDEHEQQLKHSMLAAYVTQRSTLQSATTTVERFRRAPRYDFAEFPNHGRLLYEAYSWGMTGAKWQELCNRALGELGVKNPWH